MPYTYYMAYFINKIIIFPEGTGCIPPESKCCCYAVDENHLWVVFQYPILGSKELKLHIDVVKKHGIILD